MKTKKDWQKLFPNKKLIKAEIAWCEVFETASGFEPLYMHDVIDEKSFLEMIDKNHNWLDNHEIDEKRKFKKKEHHLIENDIEYAKTQSLDARNKLPYYLKY